jgi:tetratricopeptide (TPR) repeat protein
MLGTNDINSAIGCYENAYAFTNNNTRFLYLLASLYAQNGEGEKAEESFQNFIGDEQIDPRYLVQMASFFIKGGDSSRAVQYLEEAIIGSPDLKEAYRLLKRLYEDRGETDKAGEVQKSWLARHPGESLN